MIMSAPSKLFAPDIGQHRSQRNAVARSTGILRSALDAFRQLRERRTNREIASFIAGRGERITDDLEREMTRRLMSSDRCIHG